MYPSYNSYFANVRELFFVRKIVKEDTSVSFIVIHNDAVLGESIPVTINPGFKKPVQIYNINFDVKLSFIIEDRNSVDLLVSTPVLSKSCFCTVMYLSYIRTQCWEKWLLRNMNICYSRSNELYQFPLFFTKFWGRLIFLFVVLLHSFHVHIPAKER